LRPQRKYPGRPGSATIDAGTSELAPVTDLNGIPDLSTETATSTAAADLTAIKTNNVGGSVVILRDQLSTGGITYGDAKHSTFQRNVSLRYREPSPTPASGASVERNEGNNNGSAVTVIAAAVGSDATYLVTIVNADPNTAINVVAMNNLPAAQHNSL